MWPLPGILLVHLWMAMVNSEATYTKQTSRNVGQKGHVTVQRPDLRHWPNISVAVPTCYFRHKFHGNVVAMFQHQTYPGDMELLVHDGACGTSDSSKSSLSEVMIEASDNDVRIKYYFDPTISSTGRGAVMSLGAKRNWLVNKVETELVAHFDDDDYYAPHYLEEMVTRILDKEADLVKLDGWFTYGVARDIEIDGSHPLGLWYHDFSETNIFGWGWTLVYKRKLWGGKFQFADKMEQEEDDFVVNIHDQGYQFHHFRDQNFIALRIVTHSRIRSTGVQPAVVGKNRKRVCYRYHLPSFYLSKGFGMKIERWLRKQNIR